MEKLNKVIAGLECCGRPNPTNCFDCPYRDDDVCHDTMYQDALMVLRLLKAERGFAAGLAQAYGEFVEATLEKEAK